MNKTSQLRKTALSILIGFLFISFVSTVPAHAQSGPVLSQGNLKSSGSNMENASGLFQSPPPEIAIDDPAFTYSGYWEHYNNQTGSYNNTTSAANSSGTYATYTFTGSAMTVYSKTYSNRGKMAVYLDDNLLSVVDLYTSAFVNQNPVYSASFPYGVHTVKFE